MKNMNKTYYLLSEALTPSEKGEAEGSYGHYLGKGARLGGAIGAGTGFVNGIYYRRPIYHTIGGALDGALSGMAIGALYRLLKGARTKEERAKIEKEILKRKNRK